MFTPIHVLPPELLARIFEYLVIGEEWSRKGDLLQLMLACRRWRDIAVDTASLWTGIDASSSEPIDLFVKRARGSLLSITAQLQYEQYVHFERTLMLLEPSYLPQLKDIYIEFGDGFDEDNAAPILDKISDKNIHCPQLEAFALNSDASDIVDPVVVAGFITSQATRLRTINLDGFFFPWGLSMPSLRCLTLSIRFIPETVSHPHTLKDILYSLSTMPNLEELAISEFLPAFSGGGLDVVRKHNSVPMRKIYDLELDGRGDEALVLWMLLEPWSPNGHVTTTGVASPTLVVACLEKFVRSASQYGNAAAHYSLKLWQEQTDTSATLQIMVQDTSHQSSPFISLTNAIELPDRLSLHLLRAAATLLKDVHTLEIRGTSWMQTYAESAPLLASARRLREVTISGLAPIKAFVSLLLSSGSPDEGSPDAKLPFPLLSMMHISRVDFTSSLDVEHHPQRSLGKHLSFVLEARDKAGHHLQLLHVRESIVIRKTAELWKTAVQTFKWDGKTSKKNGSFNPADLDEVA